MILRMHYQESHLRSETYDTIWFSIGNLHMAYDRSSRSNTFLLWRSERLQLQGIVVWDCQMFLSSMTEVYLLGHVLSTEKIWFKCFVISVDSMLSMLFLEHMVFMWQSSGSPRYYTPNSIRDAISAGSDRNLAKSWTEPRRSSSIKSSASTWRTWSFHLSKK